MGLDIQLLRSSFWAAADRQPDLTRDFYDRLFARSPELLPLFDRRRLPKQQRLLGETLVSIVEHLEDPAWLADHLGALGAKHLAYGVSEDMYAKVGGCLVETLAAALGPGWTALHEAAWSATLVAIRDMMLAGAERARPGKAASC